jgi:hypothetical protein
MQFAICDRVNGNSMGSIFAQVNHFSASKMTPPVYQDIATTYTSLFTECGDYADAGGKPLPNTGFRFSRSAAIPSR